MVEAAKRMNTGARPVMTSTDRKGVDFRNVASGTATGFQLPGADIAAAHLKLVSAAEEATRPFREIAERASGLPPFSGSTPALGGAFEKFMASQTKFEEAIRSSGMVDERMKALQGLPGIAAPLMDVARKIADQQKVLDRMREPLGSPSSGVGVTQRFDQPAFEMPVFLPNPIHETNRRLENIEQAFDKMMVVATNAATIANGLQSHAAEFLGKFEKASLDNDRSTKRAVGVGVAAVIMAVAMPILQIAHTELWRAPSDAASMQETISGMHTEIGALRQAQREVAERIEAALDRSDRQTAEVLRDIARSLAEQRQAIPTIKPPVE